MPPRNLLRSGPSLYLALLLTALSLRAQPVLARGDGTFRAPYTITNVGQPGPGTVHAGDLNGDGKIDLATANGSQSILIFFQSASERLDWKPVPIRVGSVVQFVRAGDFTGDGLDDLIASDLTTTAYFIRSLPGGGFERPSPLPESRGARWSAIDDFNVDGDLDVATANFSTADLTVFLGDGKGGFRMSQRLPGSREHTLESLDFDGDGFPDLILGSGLGGLTPYRGQGDGTFRSGPSQEDFGCIEYLAEVGFWLRGAYTLLGDLNHDKKGDVAATCIETSTVTAGVSVGDGTFRVTLATPGGPDIDSVAFGDWNRDGHADLAIASRGWNSLLVHAGKGDGTFEPQPAVFGPLGERPVFLITRDLDGDGLLDLVSADEASSTLTLFWGQKGERFLESGFALTGHPAGKGMAVGDLDQDGVPDLFFPRGDKPEVSVYLRPGQAFPERPSLAIQTQDVYSWVESADLDSDGRADLAGIDATGGTFLVELLDADSTPRSQASHPAGQFPSVVELGDLDAAPPRDAVVVARGSDALALFIGQGGGGFAAARMLPTVSKPKTIAVGSIDGDGLPDLAVVSDTTVAIHYGAGGGQFGPPGIVLQDGSKVFTGVAIADLNGDSIPDLAVSDSKTVSVLLCLGKGGRSFDPPVAQKTHGSPVSLELADLDGDGRVDITTANGTAQTASVLQNRGQNGFRHLVYGLGMNPGGHRLADLDLDGALDIAAFGITSGVLLFGRPSPPPTVRFVRGDVNADGDIAINDPILILGRLFLGGEPLACERAADADADGAVQLNDAVLILSRLFLGGAALPQPSACGEDPFPSGLSCPTACR